MSEPAPLAFWLLPAASAADALDSLVAELAEHHVAPRFQAHLTLLSAALDPAAAQRTLDYFPFPDPCTLEIESIHASAVYTKTLFVRFRPTPALFGLREKLAAALGLTSPGPFDPHLSLLYQDLPASVRETLAATTTLPFPSITFDAVQLITHPATITRREDVEAWRILGRRRLTSADQGGS